MSKLIFNKEVVDDDYKPQLSNKEVLLELGFPLDEYYNLYPNDLKEYGEDIICSVILEEIIEKKSFLDLFELKGDYELTKFISKDLNYTGKGIERLSVSHGFNLKKL